MHLRIDRSRRVEEAHLPTIRAGGPASGGNRGTSDVESSPRLTGGAACSMMPLFAPWHYVAFPAHSMPAIMNAAEPRGLFSGCPGRPYLSMAATFCGAYLLYAQTSIWPARPLSRMPWVNSFRVTFGS